jgi:Cu-Zn family superoxide dismutase
MRNPSVVLSTLLVLAASPALAGEIVITVHAVSAQGVGEAIGTIRAKDTPKGLQLAPDLRGLPPGARGFHVHEHPDCGPREKDGKMVAALAAGGHYDPAKTGRHEGPKGKGHLGDLPALQVGPDGRATQAVIAPRLKVADLKGRSIMIHEGGDNYADQPAPLGGGGGRIACGVVK